MAYEPREGNGALFHNDKGDNPARPDYRGDLMVGGVVYELSGWIKPVGEKRMLSLSAKPKEQRQSAPQRSAPPQRRQEAPLRPSPRTAGFDDDDGLPPF
jgi:hypothetical protein